MTISPTLPDETSPERVTLRVQDAERAATFYTEQLGMEATKATDDRWALRVPGGPVLVVLEHDPSAPARPRGTVGLYHYALLVPDRASLARTILRLQDRDVSFVGFADHGVSEAAYLEDPEGNGIEIYRDREPSRWPRRGDEVAMDTKPLPLDDLLEAADGPAGLPAGTRLGHVHLHVPDLERAGGFFEQLGFSTTQTTYPGALFLAAGSYHHHIGLNTWGGASSPPKAATGLVRVDWTLPSGALDALVDAWRAAELPLDTDGDAALVVDPVGIGHGFAEDQ